MGQFRGRVAWFSEGKGFGFVTRVGGPDLFLHKSALAKDIRAIEDGAEVEFDISGPDGRHADKVVLVDTTGTE